MSSSKLPPKHKQLTDDRVDHHTCRPCYARRAKCSKIRPVCAGCEKSGRACVWIENDSQSQMMEDSSFVSMGDTGSSENTDEKESEEAQDRLAKDHAQYESFRPGSDTDSSPLSSVNMSLLEEAESKAIDATIALEDSNDRKRKPEECEIDEAGVEVKRARQELNVGHMINEIEGYIGDYEANIATEAGTTRETTLTPPSPNDEKDSKIVATESQEEILPHAATLPNTALSTSSASEESPPPTLSPQHILLARIPGSAPLKPSTIAKAASWFAQLLTDSNGVDMIEIKRTLGIRIYRDEELEAYQKLRSEVALEKAREDALALECVVKEKERVGDDEDGTEINRQGLRSHEAAQEPEIQGHSSNVSNNTTDNAPKIPHSIDNRPYTLRLKHKGSKGFHGNRFYTADGRPKTQHARRKLEMKDMEGAEDVVRVYE